MRNSYQTAEQFLRHNRGKLVEGGKVTPQWIDGGASFRYDVERVGGTQSYLVDPAAGTRELTTAPAEQTGTRDFLAVVSPDGSTRPTATVTTCGCERLPTAPNGNSPPTAPRTTITAPARSPRTSC